MSDADLKTKISEMQAKIEKLTKSLKLSDTDWEESQSIASRYGGGTMDYQHDVPVRRQVKDLRAELLKLENEAAGLAESQDSPATAAEPAAPAAPRAAPPAPPPATKQKKQPEGGMSPQERMMGELEMDTARDRARQKKKKPGEQTRAYIDGYKNLKRRMS